MSILFDEQNGRTALVDLHDRFESAAPGDPAGRFVQEEASGGPSSAGDRQHLLFAAGERRGLMKTLSQPRKERQDASAS